MANILEVNAMGEAESGEARELNAFMANRGELWALVESCFRMAEKDKAVGLYKIEYLERDLQNVIRMGALAYVREFCPRFSQVAEFFPLAIQIETSKVIAGEFEAELEAGNSWL